MQTTESANTKQHDANVRSVLSMLPKTSAEVFAVIGDDAIIRSRLLSLGVVPGATITYEGTTPFGCPLIINVCGQRLSLRRTEAACIGVR